MAHLPSFLSGFAGALRETVAFTFLSRESAAEPSSLLRKNSSKGSRYEEIMTGGPPSPSSKSRSSQSPPNRKHRLLKALHSSTSAPADEDVERICGQTLYERLGGEEGMITAMQLFYDKVVADPKIGRFFEDVNMTRQKYKAKLFLTMIFDGPYEFIGEGTCPARRRPRELTRAWKVCTNRTGAWCRTWGWTLLTLTRCPSI
jgi:hypothetical protein